MTSPEAAQPAEGLIARDHLVYDVMPKLLQSEFCSAPWLAASFEMVHTEDQALYRRRRDFYPPGGNASLMRRCPACGRTCPPNASVAGPCVDCEADLSYERFHAWIGAPERRSINTDLLRRWWPRRPTYAEFMESPDGALLTAPDLGPDVLDLTKAEDGAPSTNEGLCDGPLTSDERPQKNWITDVRLALRIAMRRLNPRKKEAGRHPGCQIVLLPESREALLGEIAYRRRTGRIIPSALRVSHPYRRDDRFDVEAAWEWECP